MKRLGDKITNMQKSMRIKTHSFLREHPRIARLYLWVRQRKTAVATWWRTMDHRYAWWRAANIAAVVVLVLSSFTPFVGDLIAQRAYALNDASRTLVGDANPNLASQLIYNPEEQLYLFNIAAQKTDDANPAAALQAQIGASAGDTTDKSLYSLNVSAKFKEGVTYHDVNSGLEFSMKPQFSAMDGKVVDNHLVFPMGIDTQAIYTLKGNGLKEDIVIQDIQSDSLEFSYALDLPSTLEARLIPDGDGALGIYAADPALYSDMQYGSDTDRAAVQKAREAAEKTYLVFGLPAPITKDTAGNTVGQSQYILEDGTLKVQVSGLGDVSGPITVDPSVVVTSASDFNNGNNESNIDFSTSGQIARAGATGGEVGAWSTTSSVGNVREAAGAVAYNGYMYFINGRKRSPSTAYTTVEYAAINANGTLGAWSTTTDTPWAVGINSNTRTTLAAYNGYMYIIGAGDGGHALSDTYYARINSNGTLGSWTQGTSLPQAREDHGVVVWDGYIYAIAGSPVSGGNCGANGDCKNTVYYASLKADGSIGSWNTTSTLNTARAVLGTVVYDGFVYALGGADTGFLSSVEYARINSDGTLSSWTTTSSFSIPRYGMGVYAYGGYVYIAGGTGPGGVKTDVQYAQINSDGSLGIWGTTSPLSAGRIYGGYAASNGYLYMIGGYDQTANYNTVQYAKIKPAGYTTDFATASNNISSSRALVCSVAYNGYLYAIGGSTSDNQNNNVTTVQYSELDTGTGNTSGAWKTTTALPQSRGSAGCAAYNGKIYVVGGYSGSGSAKDTVYYATVNTTTGALGSWTTASNSVPTTVPDKPGVFTYANSSGTNIYVIDTCGGAPCGKIYYATLDPSTGAPGAWTTSPSVTINNTVEARGYAQVGKYLYVMGGGPTSTTATTAVEYAEIQGDGSVGTWTSTTALNTAIKFNLATAVNGCIYTYAGETGTGTSMNTVQYACPNSDGTISSWTNAPNLSVATTDSGVASWNGYIYAVGGYRTSSTNATLYARVNNGGSGSVGSWSSTTSFSTARNRQTSVAYNGYMYVIGGTAAGSYRNDVQYAKINSNGTIGSWSSTTSFSTARMGHTSVAYNGYLYIIGGIGSGGYLNDVQYAKINANGTVGAWSSTTAFTTARGSHTSVVYNGYLYIIGGNTNLSDVQYAKINANGTIGSWSTTTSLPTGSSGHSSVVYNGYIYVIGNSSSISPNVQYAKINANGTLGSWSSTTAFTTYRTLQTAVTYNGYLYIMGGYDWDGGDIFYNDVQYAPIHADGTLGTWSSTTAFTTGRDFHSTAVYNGYVYIMGGENGSDLNTVQYATLGSINRTAHYSKLIDLGASVRIKSITYNGQLSTAADSITYKSAGGNGVFGSTSSIDSIVSGGLPCSPSANLARYVWLSITIDDTESATFPDNNRSYLSDITVNYSPMHPEPDIRLRGGKTLQQNQGLSPFDTCTP